MIKELHAVKAVRPGKPIRWYVYAYRGGPLVGVYAQPNRPRLDAVAIEAVAKAQAERTATAEPSNTIAAVIVRWCRSKFWQSLAPTTKRTWTVALNRIEAKWANVPMPALSDPRARPKIVKWHLNLAETNERGADIAAMVLSKLFDWAIDQGIAMHNPAAKIAKAYQRTDRSAVIWNEADLAAINAVADQPLSDAVALAVATGLRRADLVSLRWDEIDEKVIRRVASKRSRRKRFLVTIPRLEKLDALLDELRTRNRKAGVETVLVNSYGKSWTGDGLASSFHDARAKANNGQGIWHVERDPLTGKEHRIAKRLHDFRGTFATKLMTAPGKPLTDRDVASAMGWSEAQVGEIRKRYVDDRAIVVAMTNRLRKAGL